MKSKTKFRFFFLNKNGPRSTEKEGGIHHTLVMTNKDENELVTLMLGMFNANSRSMSLLLSPLKRIHCCTQVMKVLFIRAL